MREKGKSIGRLLRSIILLIFVSFFLSSCTAYNPSMYPSYDVLNPGPEVRLNPIGFVTPGTMIEVDGKKVEAAETYTVVNDAFMMWVFELKEEIKKLRK